MNYLGTHHSTFLSWDPINNKLYHGTDKNNFLLYDIIDNNIYLKYKNWFVNLCNDIGILTNIASPHEFILNPDMSISIICHARYLSARSNGSFSVSDEIKAWEKFYHNTSDHIDQTIWAFINYKETRRKKSKKLACCVSNINYGEDWFCTDYHPKLDNKIYKLDITKNLPFHDFEIDYIHIEHGLEHIDFEDIINFTKECYRILNNNGIIRIASPCLENWIKYYIVDDPDTEKITEYSLKHFMTIPAKYNIKSKAMAFNTMMRRFGHKCILDYATYKGILNLAGFQLISKEKIHQSKWPALDNIEKRNDCYTNFETLVLEARK